MNSTKEELFNRLKSGNNYNEISTEDVLEEKRKKSKKFSILEQEKRLITVNYEDLRKSLDILYDNVDVRLDLLKNGEIYDSFGYIKLCLSVFEETSYESLLKIMSKYKVPNVIEPQTCGSFLFGEYSDCYDVGTVICNNISISKLKGNYNKRDTKGCNSGSDQVWLVKDDSIITFEVSDSEKASIYINKESYEDFDGFKTSDIDIMKQKGIKSIKLLNRGAEKDNIVKTYTNIDKIKKIDIYEDRGLNDIDNEITPEKTNNNIILLSGIILILLISVVTGILLSLIKSRR